MISGDQLSPTLVAPSEAHLPPEVDGEVADVQLQRFQGRGELRG